MVLRDGSFDIKLSSGVARGTNDNLSQAIDLGTFNTVTFPNSGTQNLPASPLTGNNNCATLEANEPNVDLSDPDEGSVWYSFTTPPASAQGSLQLGNMLKVDVQEVSGMSLTEQFYVHTYYDGNGGALNMTDLIEVDNKEDEKYYANSVLACATSIVDVTPRTRLYGCLAPSTTYYIQVVAREGALGVPLDLGLYDEDGVFTIQLQNTRPVPNTNDLLCNAKSILPDLKASPSTQSTYPPNKEYNTAGKCVPVVLNNENNYCAGVEGWETVYKSEAYDDLNHTVWYKFKAPPSGSVQFQVTNQNAFGAVNDPERNIELQLSVYDFISGSCSSNPILLELGSFAGGLGHDDIVWNDEMYVTCLDPDSTYYVRIDGDYDAITGYCAGDAMRGIFKLEMRDYDAWPARNDHICDANGTNTMPVSVNPASNECDFGVPTAGGITFFNTFGRYANNYCATPVNEPRPSNWFPEATVWFSFIAPPSGRVSVKATSDPSAGPTYDNIFLKVAVWGTNNGTCNGTPYEITSEYEAGGVTDDLDVPCVSCSCHRNEQINKVSCLVPGQRYWIEVDGNNYNSAILGCGDGVKDLYGQFDLEIKALPAPAADLTYDEACNAKPFTTFTGASGAGTTQTLTGNNECATVAAGEPNPMGWDYNGGIYDNTVLVNNGINNTIWYKFVAPATGAIKIELTNNNAYGNSLDGQVAVYSATDPCDYSTFREIQAEYDRGTLGLLKDETIDMVKCLIPGVTYYIQIDGDKNAASCRDEYPLTYPDYINGNTCKTGLFDLKITAVTPPSPAPTNDDICNAKFLHAGGAGGSLTTSGPLLNLETNICATEQTSEPLTSQNGNPLTSNYDETVWYAFKTGAGSGTVTIDITNSTIYSLAGILGGQHTIAVYESISNTYQPSCPSTNFSDLKFYTDVPNLPYIIGSPNNSVTLTCLKPNWIYYVQVDGFDLGLAPNMQIGGKFLEQGTFSIQATLGSAGSGGTRPVNDNVCNAAFIGGGSGVVPALGSISSANQNNYCAGTEVNEPNGMDWNCDAVQTLTNLYCYDETVWYKFTTANTPGSSRTVRVDVNNGADFIQPTVAVMKDAPICSGTAPNQLANFSAMSLYDQKTAPSGFGDVSVTASCLEPNTTYYVQVDGWDVTDIAQFGTFTITATDLGSGALATNDDICGAINTGTFTGGAQTLPVQNGTTACATEETAEPNTSGLANIYSDNYDETVWYYFKTSSTPGAVTINLNSASKFQGFNLYQLNNAYTPNTGGWDCSATPSFGALTLFDQTGIFNGVQNVSRTVYCLNPDTYYYIQIDAYDDLVNGNTDGGSFTLTVSDNGVNTGPPLNDNIAYLSGANNANFGTITNAAGVTRSRPADYNILNNYCATDELGEPDVDYSIADNLNGADETVWYRFRTDATPGDYVLDFTNNTVLGGDPAIIIKANLYKKNTAAYNYAPGNLTLVTSDVQIPGIYTDFTYRCLDLNTEYLIQVDGEDITDQTFAQLAKGEWDLTIRKNTASGAVHNDLCNASPANAAYNLGTVPNTCAGSLNLPFNSVETNNTCANVQSGEPGVSSNDETVWYYFTAPTSGAVTITVNGNDPSTTSNVNDMIPTFKLYHSTTGATTCNFGQLEYVDGTSSFLPDLINKDETLTTDCLVPGHVYYVQIDGWDSPLDQYGKFSIDVKNGYYQCPGTNFTAPANDEPCGAITLPIGTTACSDNTMTTNASFIRNATTSPATWNQNCGQSYCSGDQWYTFTVPAGNTNTVLVQGENNTSNPFSPTDLNIEIFRQTGGLCPNPSLTLVTCSHNGEQIGVDIQKTFTPVPGATYYVKVSDADGTWNNETFGICITQICSSDACASATNMVLNTEYCWDLNGSSSEPVGNSYPDCNDNQVAAHSVYYAFGTYGLTPAELADGLTITFFGFMNVQLSGLFGTSTGCNGIAGVDCDRAGVTVSIFEDNTPCDGNPENVIDCYTTDVCNGALTGFIRTYTNLKPNHSYVIQINSNEFLTACLASTIVTDVNPIDHGSISISTTNPTAILPVELTTFTGYNNGSINVLNWTTASELNSLKFVVEKSIDAVHFDYLGERPAAGNSSIPRNYTLNDLHPVIGNNYYRLKMIDRDGQFKYSEIITIKVTEIAAPSDGIVAIYPNPTNDKVNVVYQSGAAQRVNLDVFNTVGQNMYNNTYEFNTGLNTIVIDAVQYAKGMYIINLQNTTSGDKYLSKFVKD
ncbi:MAG: T9SS type A sorting domain-containing protein [Sphingobacteriales bacterium]|nr:T9SS type A sorting domain-containing protein [Sphingobacteriales bacterium]